MKYRQAARCLHRTGFWLTAEATSTELSVGSCRRASTVALIPKDADGYSTLTSKGKTVRDRNVFLPDCTGPEKRVAQAGIVRSGMTGDKYRRSRLGTQR